MQLGDSSRDYTFKAYTLMTNQKLGELPLYGVYMESLLNDVGQFNGMLQFTGDARVNRVLKDLTTPGKTVVYAFEDGLPIEAYIIWTRTYQATSRTLQITGQTLESYPYKNIIRSTFERYDKTSSNQLATIWSTINNTNAGNILIDPYDLVLKAEFGSVTDLEVYPDMFRTYGEVMEEMMNAGSGIDIKILPAFLFNAAANPDQDPVRRIYADTRLGRPLAQSNLALEFPGNLNNYWFTENAAESATNVFATSTDMGWETVVANATDSAAYADGYPAIEQRFTFETLRSQAKLQSRADQKLVKLKIPHGSVTMEIAPANMPALNDIDLGDDVLFSAEDEWFPDGYSMTKRLLGWNISLGSSEVPDTFNLIIEGSDDA